MKKTHMNRETQKWLRETVRKEFPTLVGEATFYYQAGGIKFWGVRPGGKSVRTVKAEVERMLQRTGGWLKGNLQVYTGQSHETSLPALYILIDDDKGPKLEAWRKIKPAVFDHSGFGDPADLALRTKIAKDAGVSNSDEAYAMLMKKMDAWIRLMKRCKGQMSAFQINQLARDMQDTRSAIQKLSR